ncbi:MAG: hypothetical protein WBW93_09185 [Steroidobacteraceae bacterium]
MSEQTVYTYVGDDPIGKTDPFGRDGDSSLQWDGFSAAQLTAAAEMAQVQDMKSEAGKELLTYDNRQAELKTAAAGFALTSAIPGVDVVTGPVSAALTIGALYDEKVTTGHFDTTEALLTVLGVIPGAKALGALTKLKHGEEISEAAQHALHATASVAAAGQAVAKAAAPAQEAHGASQSAASPQRKTFTYTPLGSRIARTITCSSATDCVEN